VINLDEHDVRRIASRLPQPLRELLEKRSDLAVAGGFIRTIITNERVSDVDVFGSAPLAVKAAADDYAEIVKDRDPVETENAVTVRGRPPVQFIHKWTFDTKRDLVQSFDFTIARSAIWFEGAAWQSIADDRFYIDLAARRLVYASPAGNTAGGTLLRLQKFVARGYRASAFNIAKIAQDLAAAAGGDDLLVKALARLIREVDPRSPEWGEERDERPDAPPQPDDDIAF
jgi:hypothetical protein